MPADDLRQAVQHDDHVDYVVGDHLHHQRDDHCHDHGPVAAGQAQGG